MPRRVTFTDTTTGRFVSAADAFDMEGILRSVYDGGLKEQAVLDFGQVREITVQGEQNWTIDDSSRWGGRITAGDDQIDISSLQASAFPEGYNGFRVTYFVADNPDYPRKYASAEWMGADQWPPELNMLEDVATTGIAHVILRKSQ